MDENNKREKKNAMTALGAGAVVGGAGGASVGGLGVAGLGTAVGLSAGAVIAVGAAAGAVLALAGYGLYRVFRPRRSESRRG